MSENAVDGRPRREETARLPHHHPQSARIGEPCRGHLREKDDVPELSPDGVLEKLIELSDAVTAGRET